MILFEKTGKENTEQAVKLGLEKAMLLSSPLVVATTSGETLKLAKAMADGMGFQYPMIGVSHVYGFRQPGQNEMSEELRKELIQKGVIIVSAAHALSGAERSLSNTFKGAYPVEIIAHTLRMFSQGVKVCVEMGAMVLDAGVVEYGKEIVFVAGTGRGADTVCTLTPEYSHQILKTKIHEIVCKPY